MTDILSSLFGNIPFDIQGKIYNEVLIIQDKERNIRYFSGYVLGELKYNWLSNDNDYDKFMKNKMINIYEKYHIGSRLGKKHKTHVEYITKYDKLYYDNLDYLMMCDLNTDVEINEDTISWEYEVKECYSHFGLSYFIEQTDKLLLEYDGNYFELDEEQYVLYENFYGFVYKRYWIMFEGLNDFCSCCIEEEACPSDDLVEQMIDMYDNNFQGIGNEELTLLLTKFTKGKIF